MSKVEERFWSDMGAFTRARIGLGRAGAAVRTETLLHFQLAAARARDAVYHSFDPHAVERAVSPTACIHVSSRATDRVIYLRRPDLGRRLSSESLTRLSEHHQVGGYDIVFVIADGLSPSASITNAAPLIDACIAQLSGWEIAPVVIASQSRVALGDEIAGALGARSVAILLGERPGLSVPDSLGLYFTWNPAVGTPDSKRNCISNIHAAGLSNQAAAKIAVWLIREAARLKISGVTLKENAGRDQLSGLSPALLAPLSTAS
jgi:ethanolamine ammonia-lyase small subunit